MEYSLGKWLEKVETKLNALLEVNGLDPNTLQPLEPIDQTQQTPEQPEEPDEQIDEDEPEAGTQEELDAKAAAIQKSMNRGKVDIMGNPIPGKGAPKV